MNIALALIRLRNKEIGDVAPNVVLVARSVASEHFLKSTRQSAVT